MVIDVGDLKADSLVVVQSLITALQMRLDKF